jgi:ATP-dependent DNA ligase
MHPKTSIPPTRAAIDRVLRVGWWGQLKIHGHRAQVHVPANPQEGVLVFNRHGQLHRMALPESMVKEVRRLFQPKQDWNVIDAEWLKPEAKLFVFDFIKREGDVLSDCTYAERYELLPRVYASPHIQTLGVFKTVDQCMKVLADPAPEIEGLVLRSPATKGFLDSSIVRCRKTG